MNFDDDSHILSRLGILTSTLQSPKKLEQSKGMRTHDGAAVLNDVSLSSSSRDGESEDDVIFDKNSLLNPRKSKRRRRSSLNRLRSGVSNEAIRWKLFCLSCSFCVIGICVAATGSFLSQITSSARLTSVLDSSDFFAFNGFGFLLGSVFVSVLFTRLNPFILLTMLIFVSIPCTALTLWHTSVTWLRLAFFLQGLALGAIERGGIIMVFGIWKGRPRVLYGIYLCLTLGIAVSSVVGSRMLSSASVSEAELVPHTLHKREMIVDINATTSVPLSSESATTKPTRPSSAVGIDVNTDTKTAENAEKRKEAESKQKAQDLTTPTVNCTDDNSTDACLLEQPKSTSPPTTFSTTTTTPSTTSTTTTPTTTATTTTPTATKLAPPTSSDVTGSLQYNRGRNRQHKSGDAHPSTTYPSSQTASTNAKVGQRLKMLATGPSAAIVYVVSTCLVLSLPLLAGFCCCCLKTTTIADLRISQLKIDEAKVVKEPLTCKVSANFIWLVHGAIQAMLLAYLPSYAGNFSTSAVSSNLTNPAYASAFWLAATLSFALFAVRPVVANSSLIVHLSYVSSIVSCALFHHIFAPSHMSALVGICLVGFFTAALPQIIVMWHFDTLGTPAYTLSRRYAASSSLGRCIGPVIYAHVAKQEDSTNVLFGCVFALLLCAYFGVNVLACSMRSWSRKREIRELGGEVDGQLQSNNQNRSRRKRKGPYKALLDAGAEESDVDIEMDFVIPETSESSEGL